MAQVPIKKTKESLLRKLNKEYQLNTVDNLIILAISDRDSKMKRMYTGSLRKSIKVINRIIN